MNLIDDIVARTATLTAIRRDIHAHPETYFEENRTSDLVARKLTEWGIEVHRGLGKTGVVGLIHGRDGGASNDKGTGQGRMLGLRADMDALPMHEVNTFAHASKTPGKMHACGHDGHTTMLLAAAQQLALTRNFDGTVVVIFQPAEEEGGGAQVMINEGLFEQFPVEAVFGMHNWPGIPAGQIAVSAGPVMASTNEFKITIRGRGSHGAMPHLGIDPVPIACQIVQGFQTIISRNTKPLDTAVLSVTMIHAGEASNVVPDFCEIQGTVRTFRTDVLDLIESRMEEVARHTCAAHQATCGFKFKRAYPATVNDPAASDFARAALIEVAGEANVIDQEPSMAAEDFSFMLQAKPGAYFFIGNGDGAHRENGHGNGPCMLHNTSYDFNDALLPLGASAFVRLAERWLGTPRP